MVYLFIIILLFCLFVRYDYRDRKRKKDWWYNFVLVIFILLAGLRWRVGGDTAEYLYAFYDKIPYLWNLTMDEFLYSRQEPFYLLLNVIVKSLGGKFFVVQLLQASIVNILLFKYFKKHCQYIFSCLLLYFVWFYVFLNFEEMRAGISISICLFANDFIVDKKIIKGISLYLLAALFHYSSLVLLMTPLFMFLKFDWKGALFVLSAIFIAYFVQMQIGDYLFLFELNESTSDKMTNFIESGRYFSQDLNIIGVTASIGPYLFYAVLFYIYLRKSKHTQARMDIEKLQPFVLLGLFYVIFSVYVPIGYRLLRFYQVYLTIYLVVIFAEETFRSKQNTVSSSIMSIVLLVPMLWILYSNYFNTEPLTGMKNYHKYIPYSTIIDKTVGTERERWSGIEKSADKRYY